MMRQECTHVTSFWNMIIQVRDCRAHQEGWNEGGSWNEKEKRDKSITVGGLLPLYFVKKKSGSHSKEGAAAIAALFAWCGCWIRCLGVWIYFVYEVTGQVGWLLACLVSCSCKFNRLIDCWVEWVRIFKRWVCGYFYVTCLYINESKEEATLSEKLSLIPSGHASFVDSKAKTKATHVWQADVSNNLAPLADYIWRGERAPSAKKCQIGFRLKTKIRIM